MNMTTRRWLWILGAGLFVGVNAYMIWSTFDDHNAPTIGDSHDQQEERGRLVSEWYSAEVTDLFAEELAENVAAHVDSEDCFTHPEGAEAFDLTRLTQTQRRDLTLAISGIIRAYAEGTPEAVLSYMRQRGEVLVPRKVRRMRDALKESTDLAARSIDINAHDDVWAWYWKDRAYGAKWSGLVHEPTCVRLWTSGTIAVNAIASGARFVQDEKHLWRNFTFFPHHFEPADGYNINAEIESAGSVLAADVRVIIEHTAELDNRRSPFYFRFWYNPEEDRWHPLLMARMRTQLTARDRVKFLF